MYPDATRRFLNRSPAARRLAALDRARHLGDAEGHGKYVATLFDAVEPSYDRFTRCFSFGMDARWKRTLLGLVRAGLPREAVCVDLATGTGDLAAGAATLVPQGRVVGLDFSRGMVDAARRRLTAAGRIRLAVGDMMRVPIAGGRANAVTAAYGFRNVADPAAAVAEAFRILRPRGVLATLDFYRPPSWAWRTLFLRYLGAAGSLAGWWWHRVPATYGYIAPSLERWVSAAEFSLMLERQGFGVEQVHEYLWGGVAVHLARKPATPPGS